VYPVAKPLTLVNSLLVWGCLPCGASAAATTHEDAAIPPAPGTTPAIPLPTEPGPEESIPLERRPVTRPGTPEPALGSLDSRTAHVDVAAELACVGRVDVVGGRFPFLPVCVCGQRFRGYVADHAARDVLKAHLNGEC
jgi:hypothetical protein